MNVLHLDASAQRDGSRSRAPSAHFVAARPTMLAGPEAAEASSPRWA